MFPIVWLVAAVYLWANAFYVCSEVLEPSAMNFPSRNRRVQVFVINTTQQQPHTHTQKKPQPRWHIVQPHHYLLARNKKRWSLLMVSRGEMQAMRIDETTAANAERKVLYSGASVLYVGLRTGLMVFLFDETPDKFSSILPKHPTKQK